MRLFGHRYRLQVDDFRFDGLDIRFDVELTTSVVPNNATITVINLNSDHRKKLQQLDRVFVRLEAGWDDGIWEIFRGDLRDVISTRQGPDWETVITSGDGEGALTRARVKLSLGAGAKLSTVVRMLAEAMGLTISAGTVSQIDNLAFLTSKAKVFPEGIALHGNAADALKNLLAGTAYTFSVQAGELQILERGGVLAGDSIRITPDTGLVGSPEPGAKDTTEVTTLIIPGLFPGRRVVLDTEQVKGPFRCNRVVYTGDTKYGDWFARCELGLISPISKRYAGPRETA